MAQLQVNLSNIQSVVYNSTSKGKIEPTVVKFGNAATWAKPYTLTIPALPTGVSSCTITRSSTQFTGASTGTIVTAGASAKIVTVYHGDVLSISATAATGYNNPNASLSQTTVIGNITSTVTAGSLLPSWHKLGTSSGTYSSTSRYTKFKISVSCGDTNSTIEFSSSGTKNVSGTHTTSGTPIQCPCGEYGEHWCACYGENYDPGNNPPTTTTVTGTVTLTKNSNSIVVSTTGSATVYYVGGWG